MAELEVGQVQREDKSDGLFGSSGGAGCIEDSRVVGPDVILLAAQDLITLEDAWVSFPRFCHLRGQPAHVGEVDSPPARMMDGPPGARAL